MKLSDRLKLAREAAELTQPALAKKSGVSQQLISKIENDQQEGTTFVAQLADALGVRPQWLATGEEPMRDSDVREERITDFVSAHRDKVRQIPVISYVEAGSWKEIMDSYAKGAGFDSLSVDAALAQSLGRHAFALEVHGESMMPEFRPGDRVIVDQDAAVRPGDVVVAKLDREESATLKKYRSRGVDEDGNEVFELVPLNDDYPTLAVNRSNPGKIIGRVVEHRKRM
jgi:SOS-response transcriptional repressor LexA